ncbi:unnamed protein product [Cochlearia groenlandica]
MESVSWPVVAMVVILLLTMAQGYPQEDLVVKLPGQPTVGFRQYAGYVDIDLKSGRSLFYYYVEAETHPDTKPLTLWLNGGPGCSSVGGGAFTELGPFYPTGDGRGLRVNSMSWNKASNLLFVESPAGVGWSYSNQTSDYNTSDETTASDMLIFFLRWFDKFPELKSRDLFLTGESYAGHYIPQLADKFLSYTSHSSGFKFNIKGLAIGNPLLNLDRDAPASYEFYWSHGMMSDELKLTITSQCTFQGYTFASPHNVSEACNAALNKAEQIVSEYVNSYDVILDVCYPSIVEQELRLKQMVSLLLRYFFSLFFPEGLLIFSCDGFKATKMSIGVDVCMSYERRFYLNLPEVQRALHANRTHLPYTWSMCSNLLNYSEVDGNIDMLPILKRILQNKIPIWIFSGDQDSVVPLLGSRTLVRELAHDFKFEVTVPYGVWFHRKQVGGWVIEYGKLLTFATVRGAAHMVPYAQPSRALQLFRSFVAGQRLPNTTYV